MVEDILIDASKEGYSTNDIIESVVKMLQPYFTHIDILKKYACDSQLLSAYDFFVGIIMIVCFFKG